MQMEKKRVCIYCRVAHEDDFSLSAQADELRRYAEKNGHILVSISAEYGSGLTLNRPALAQVTNAIIEGKVDVVSIKSLSRIGRDWGMVQQYIDLLTSHNVTLLCVTEGLEISNHNFYPFSLRQKNRVSL